MSGADEPRVGQIVLHHFLWVDEQAAGRREGRKARPCLIVAVEPVGGGGAPRVTVLPITSQIPRGTSTAVAIPDAVKARIGLDRVRNAWVVVDEANVFVWPGFDLIPSPGGRFERGTVTRGFFRKVRDALLAAHSRGRPRRIDRD